MLVFGPYNAVPQDDPDMIVFNFSSMTEAIPRLPGLVVSSYVPELGVQQEYEFDQWYYDYVLNDPVACASLMTILNTLYQGKHVFVCITDYLSDPFMATLNESFMKIIQTRYDIKYSIINEASDMEYVPKDGCDFMTVQGIMNFDADRKRFMEVSTEELLLTGVDPMKLIQPSGV